MIISLEKITKYYSGETVLNNAALTVEDNDRIGLVGINGSGKTTLIRIMTGLESPENLSAPNEPVIYKARDKTIGYLAQNSALDTAGSVYSEMRSVFAELDGAAARLSEIEQDMTEKNAAEYSRLMSYFETNDGYLIGVKINRVLNGMGFMPDTYERRISTFSGGERTRLNIAKLLLQNPDLLILDEPTNHLDTDTVMWLEDYLSDYKGAFLIVSHDRYFLDRLCTSICEVSRGRLRRFKGNYTAFVRQREDADARQLKEYEAQQREIAKLEDYVARNLVRASTSDMAKSRIKKLEAMERIEKPVLYEKTAHITFEYSIKPHTDVLSVRDLTVTAGEGGRPLISALSFDARRGDKIGIIGANGIGKSMLLKTLQGIIPPAGGTVKWGKNVKIAYFDQENARLDLNGTVINQVHNRYRNMTEGEIRSLLARVRLTGDDVFKQAGVISGGERAKLCFALMVLERGNVLILDEPTNHLDIAAREVIETALSTFDGTVIFVSHDRYLVNLTATRIIEITENGVNIYNGGFDAYMAQKREAAAQTDAPAAAPRPKQTEQGYRDKAKRAQDAKKRGRVKELESEIENLENEIKQFEEDLCSPDIYADYTAAKDIQDKLDAAKQRLDAATDEWLELSAE